MAVGQPASAAIISINTYLSGDALGNPREVATIEATQQGSDVLFKFTNKLDITGSFERQLFLDYNPTAANPLASTQIMSVSCGVVTPCDAPQSVSKGTFDAHSPDDFNFLIQWSAANNPTRLTFGDMSFFKITNATLANFFQNSQDALVQIQGLPNGGSSQYVNGVNGTTAIPLPASLPLFLAGLAGFGVLTRRRRGA